MADQSIAEKYEGPATLVPEPVEPPCLPQVPMKAADEPPGFFDKPEKLKKLQVGFLVVVASLILLDVSGFVHYHEELGLEHIPGFYTLFSLVACVILFALAKTAAAFVKRGEDYYD